MKTNISSLLLTLLMISAGHSQQRINYGESRWGRIDYVGTQLSPEKCDRVTRLQNKPFRICPPVAGYQLLYGGNEASPEIIIVSPNRKRHIIHYWDLAAGNFRSLEKELSWQVARSRTGKVTPMALILQAKINQDEFTRFPGEYTIIAKLTPTEVCVIGRVPTGPHAAMDLAIFTSAPQLGKCIAPDNVGERDWLGVVFGLSGKGQYEEAKSAIKEIQSPSTRTVGYLGVARAQAESGDQKAARTTLLLGWDDIISGKLVTIYRDVYGTNVHDSSKNDNLIRIIVAMAVAGLDNDVNDKLKFVSNSDLPQALLLIGRLQGSSPSVGGKGDRAAANATFKRAVELERMRADRTAADSNLFSIVQAQVEVGLINEAKQTALLIKNLALREAAERAISSSN